MKKLSLVFLSILLMASLDGQSQSNKDKNKNNGNNGNGNGNGIGNGNGTSNGNGPKPEHNVFPPYGDVGIGTRYPSEKLEVIGNAIISQTLDVNQINVIGLNTTTISVAQDATIGNNLLVNGSIGIGVAMPSEKLDIAGNLKVSSTIYSQLVNTTGLNSGTGNISGLLTVGENMIVSGLTGLGVDNPMERLEVSGNIKATERLFANGFEVQTGLVQGNLSVGQNTLISGSVGIGSENPAEKLDVVGNIKASQKLFADGFQVNSGQVSNNLTVDQNTLIGGSVGIGVVAPSEKLDVAGNIKSSGDLISVGIQIQQGSISKDLQVGEDVVVMGNIGIGIAVPQQKLDVQGNIRASQNLLSDGLQIRTGSVTENLAVGSNLNVSENFTLGQNALISGRVGIGVTQPSQALDVNGSINVSDYAYLNQVSAKGISAQTLNVSGNIRTESELLANAATITSLTAANAVIGDINSTGVITAKIIEADEIRVPGLSTGGENNFNKLGINTEGKVPQGYVMAVAGDMIATRIEVQAPTNWPDYVFEKTYKLRSLSEVEEFIRQEGHLPEMPSAQEMQEGEGYGLAQMDANLLEKIEELTLYMIALKKENETLKLQIQKLQHQ